MTDARLPSRWLLDPRIEELTDRAWRTFTGMLMWSNEQGTDGVIPQRSVRLLHPDGVPASVLTELITAGLIEPKGGALAVVDWTHTQSAAADVEGQRARNRAKNAAARQRARDRKTTAPSTSSTESGGLRSEVVTGHDAGRVTGQPGGQDSDRQGQASRPPIRIAAGGITDQQRRDIAESWRTA